ncbi:CbtA family protein [Nocardioides sp. Leaf285]|uniref:CbtA family protein n=1 Tax=Nocardioides sp. Leaf285 TaxID=1736322 RepID=UPI000A837322|nr:CbtA family protein [Nocardioides sp. Leaf285]
MSPATTPAATRMTPRAFLVSGLLVGLLAGCAAFLVATWAGEPAVEAAIAREGGHDHAAGTPEHTHDPAEEEVVSRSTQRTWGLLTGSVAVGVALGGLLALGAAAAVGRLGPLRPGPTAALVAGVGFVSVALVPFLKYPALPPGVGSAETIGSRTALYFTFVAVSVAAAVVAVLVARRLLATQGGYAAVLVGTALYLLVVVGVAVLLPGPASAGDVPADLLWSFRRGSLLTLLALWGVLVLGLAAAVDRLGRQEGALRARRELAASL